MNKPRVSTWYRKFTNPLIGSLPWPNVNPNWVSISTIFLSLLIFIPERENGWFIAILILVWFVDIADGAIARKHNRITVTGAMVDLWSDRMSELIIAIAYDEIWYWALWTVNLIMTIQTHFTRWHFGLAIRQALVIWLMIQYLV